MALAASDPVAKIKGTFCEKTLNRIGVFDKRSFRWIKRGSNWLLIGCPKRSWKRDRCTAGTKAYKILVKTGRCPVGKRVRK